MDNYFLYCGTAGRQLGHSQELQRDDEVTRHKRHAQSGPPIPLPETYRAKKKKALLTGSFSLLSINSRVRLKIKKKVHSSNEPSYITRKSSPSERWCNVHHLVPSHTLDNPKSFCPSRDLPRWFYSPVQYKWHWRLASRRSPGTRNTTTDRPQTCYGLNFATLVSLGPGHPSFLLTFLLPGR